MVGDATPRPGSLLGGTALLLALALPGIQACKPAEAACDDPVSCERACDERNPETCFEAGRMFVAGIGCKRQPERAATLFERACLAGHPGACTYLASAYQYGVGVVADRPRAERLYESACNGGDGRACVGLGLLYELENPSLATMLLDRGVEQLRGACKREPGSSCAALGLLHLQGVGVTANVEQGRRYYAMACTAGDLEACATLAEEVRGEDPQRAAALYDQACNGGYLYACVQHGVDLLLGKGVDADPAAGAQRLRMACEWGEPRGCATLATAHLSGIGVPVDEQAAVDLYEQGCRADDAYACG
ncbi:MAG: sel1 repeat family protein, partial [Myxococcales bacterium]|nr:sel1 repeat family protein [Myxococcales bacterium]